VTRDISEGPPKTECITSMFDKITEGMQTLGTIALITGIFTLAGFIGTFALCGDNPADKYEE